MVPLRELLLAHGIKETISSTDDQLQSVDKAKFRSSFRIIAKQNGIQKEGHVFVLAPDFDVEYTIEAMPEYETYLNRYQAQHGTAPDDYKKVVELYDAMAQQIKHYMPKAPMCRDYFNMLGTINFLAYYCKTLKALQKVPVLNPKTVSTYQFPHLLPPLPTRYPKIAKVKLTMADAIQGLSNADKQSISDYIQKKANNEHAPLSDTALSAVMHNIKSIIDQDFYHPTPDLNAKGIAMALIASLAEHYFECFESQAMARQRESLQEIHRQNLNALKEFDQAIARIDRQGQDAKREIDLQISRAQSNVAYGYEVQIDWGLVIQEKNKIDQQIKVLKSKLTQEKQRAVNEIETQRENLNDQSREAETRVNTGQRQRRDKFQEEISVIGRNLHRLRAGVDAIKQIPHKINQFIQDPLSDLQILSSIGIEYNSDRIGFGFPQREFYEDQNRNFRVIGGCGLRLPDVEPVFSKLALDVAHHHIAAIDDAENETFVSLDVDGEFVHVFKIVNDDFSAAHASDYRWMTETMVWSDAAPSGLDECVAAVASGDVSTVKTLIEMDFLTFKNRDGQTLLHYAVLSGKKKMVVFLLAQPGTIADAADNNGQTPFQLAAYLGNVELLETLRPSANIDATQKNGATALYLAVMNGQLAAVNALVKWGAKVNTKLVNGFTPLHSACHHQHEEIALHLLTIPDTDVNGALEDGTTPLYVASELGMARVVSALLTKGARINAPRRDKMTALHAAVRANQLDSVTALLTHQRVEQLPNNQTYIVKDINVNARLDSGITPLHIAAEQGNEAMIYALLKAGANPNLTGFEDETPLMSAIRNGQVYPAFQLVDQSASEAVNVRNDTAYQIAAQLGLWDIVMLMVKTNDQILKKDHNDNTILHYFVLGDRYDLFHRYFEQLNRISKLQFKSATTLQETALRNGKPGMVAYLRRHGFEFEGIRMDQYKPIHFAAQFGMVGFIQYWLKSHDVKVKDIEVQGKNLAYMAAENGQLNALRMLHEAGATLVCGAGHALLGAVYSQCQKTIDYCIHQVKNPNDIVAADKDTFLHIAARIGNPNLLKFLRSRGADFERRSRNAMTAFHIVVEQGNKSCWDYLIALKNEFKFPRDLVYFAAKQGRASWLPELVDRMPVGLTYQGPKTNNSVLHAAVLSKDIQVLKFVLSRAPQLLNLVNLDSDTALCLAVKSDWVDGMALLIQHGASMDVPGSTLMHLAVQARAINAVNFLNARGLRVEATDRQGQTALSLADPGFSPLLTDPSGTKELLSLFCKTIQTIDESKPDPLTIRRVIQLVDALDINQAYSVELGVPGPHTLLETAIYLKKPSIVKYLIQKGSPLTRINPLGLSPLHIMVAKGMGNLIQDCDPSVPPDFKTKDGYTFMHFAALSGDLSTMKLLVARGGNLDAFDHRLNTPMAIAVSKGYRHIVDWMVKSGVRLTTRVTEDQVSYLHIALAEKQIEMALFLIQIGISIDVTDRKGRLPLHIAASQGLVSMLPLLAMGTSNVDAADDDGETALHFAGRAKTEAGVTLLLELGANPGALEKREQLKPVDLAALTGNIAAVKALLETTSSPLDADDKKRLIQNAVRSGCVDLLRYFQQINLLDSQTDTKLAVLRTVQNDYIQLLDVLVEMGCSLDQAQLDGMTALQMASESGVARALKYLIDHDVQMDVSRIAGSGLKTPIQGAVENGHITESRLLAPFSDLDQRTNDQQTLLHLAAESGKSAIVGYMIQLGIDLDATDAKGQTALAVAIQKNHDAVPVLLAAGANPLLIKDNVPTFCPAHFALFNRYQQAWLNNKFTPRTRLHVAIALDNRPGFDELSRYLDLNEPNLQGQSPAHIAILEQSDWALRRLIQQRASFVLKDAQNMSPMMVAFKHYSIDQLDRPLIEAVFKRSLRDSDFNPLSFCFEIGALDAFKWAYLKLNTQQALSADAIAAVDRGDIPSFIQAVFNDKVDVRGAQDAIFHVILEQNNIPFWDFLNAWFDVSVVTFFHNAVVRDAEEMVEACVKKAPSLLLQPDPTGFFPLALAYQQGATATCQVLERHGAKLDTSDLSLGILHGKHQLIHAMLEKGFEPSESDWKQLRRTRNQSQLKTVADFTGTHLLTAPKLRSKIKAIMTDAVKNNRLYIVQTFAQVLPLYHDYPPGHLGLTAVTHSSWDVAAFLCQDAFHHRTPFEQCILGHIRRQAVPDGTFKHLLSVMSKVPLSSGACADLMSVSATGDMDALYHFIEHGAYDLNLPVTDDGRPGIEILVTALITTNQRSVLTHLMSHFDIKTSNLFLHWFASARHNETIFNFLLTQFNKHGVMKETFNEPNPFVNPSDTELISESADLLLLHAAIDYGFGTAVNLILDMNEIDVNQTIDGQPALHRAVLHQRRDIVERLIAHGANPYFTNTIGQTALQIDPRFDYLPIDLIESWERSVTNFSRRGIPDVIVNSKRLLAVLPEMSLNAPEPAVSLIFERYYEQKVERRNGVGCFGKDLKSEKYLKIHDLMAALPVQESIRERLTTQLDRSRLGVTT